MTGRTHPLARLLAAAAVAATLTVSTAPRAAAGEPAAGEPAAVEVAAVCNGAVTAQDGSALVAGARLPVGRSAADLYTDDGARVWVVLPGDASLYVGPRSHVRVTGDAIDVQAGSVELVTAARPVPWRVGPAGGAGTARPHSTLVLSAGGGTDVGVREPTHVTAVRGSAELPWAGRAPVVVAAGEQVTCGPGGPRRLEAGPVRHVRPVRCPTPRPLLPLSLVPIERPAPEAVAKAKEDFVGAFSSLAGGDVGDAVSSCGCVEPGGGAGASGDLGGGATLPDVDRRDRK